MMSAKIDFNVLLAQADKNTNKAQKLLEEKKQLYQKKKQNINSTKIDSTKESELAFQKRREEIRKRNEQEAKELLDQKKKKDAIKNIQSNSKTIKTKLKTNQVSNEAVQNYLKSKDDSKKGKSSNFDYKHSSIGESNNNDNSTTSNNLNRKTKSFYDQLPNTSKKTISKFEKNSIVKDDTTKKDRLKKTSNGSLMSYDQMLKLADNFHKESKVATVNKIEPISSNDYSNLLYGNNKIKKSEIPKKKVEEIKKIESNVHLRTHINKTADPLKISKAANKSNLVPITSGTSAWDRIISDMKKKPGQKFKKNESKIEENIDSDTGEDEYDSEMDDFIDDESCEEDGDQKDYKKTIHEIFKYDPKRYQNINLDDVDNMETDYHSQLKEEKISLKLGILEDLEEKKKEDEEERRKLLKQKKHEILFKNKDNKRHKLEKN